MKKNSGKNSSGIWGSSGMGRLNNSQQLMRLMTVFLNKGMRHALAPGTAVDTFADALAAYTQAKGTPGTAKRSLCSAVRKNDLKAIADLLNTGADPNIKSLGGVLPMTEAVDAGNTEAVMLLLKAGADPNLESRNERPLTAAVCRKNPEMVQLLIAAGADLNKADPDRVTPLSAAVYRDADECLKLLLEAGADPNAWEGRLYSPLFIACTRMKRKNICVLLKYGADINEINGFGSRPLHIAASSGSAACMACLIRAGADLFIPDSMGMTPMDLLKINFPETYARYGTVLRKMSLTARRLWREDIKKTVSTGYEFDI